MDPGISATPQLFLPSNLTLSATKTLRDAHRPHGLGEHIDFEVIVEACWSRGKTCCAMQRTGQPCRALQNRFLQKSTVQAMHMCAQLQCQNPGESSKGSPGSSVARWLLWFSTEVSYGKTDAVFHGR